MTTKEDLIAWKWAESLSAGEQSVLLNSSIKRLQSYIDRALAQQREKFARVCDQRADRASMNETEFDSIGEYDLLPSIKFWEGQRMALQEFAVAFRAGDKE